MSAVKVLWIGKYAQKWETVLHKHRFFQIIGTAGGAGTVEANGMVTGIREERIHIFPPDCMHRIRMSGSGKAPRILDIKFEVNDPGLADDLGKLGTNVQIQRFLWFSGQFNEILEESIQVREHSHHRINAIFCCFLIQIIREKLHQDDPERNGWMPPAGRVSPAYTGGVDIDGLLRHIESHYSDSISLNELANLAAVNKSTLNQIFRENFNATPIQYINRIRLQKARDLLINTDVSISEIAYIVGFQSIHYFSRYFKMKQKCSPSEYRCRIRENRFINLVRLPGASG